MLRLVARPENELKQHLAKIGSYLTGGAITRGEAHRAVRSAHRAIREVASRPKDTWKLGEGLNQMNALAHSKSEARKIFKRMLGVKRLPAGTVIQRIDPRAVKLLDTDDVPF